MMCRPAVRADVHDTYALYYIYTYLRATGMKESRLLVVASSQLMLSGWPKGDETGSKMMREWTETTIKD